MMDRMLYRRLPEWDRPDPAPRPTLAERFWVKVTKGEGCWLWNAGRFGGNGRPAFGVEGKMRIASRVAYRLTHGDFDASMCVCHTCDNPACVRPDHLWLGTHKDNTQDAIRKGRMTWQRLK
jgi:hypothetical protein